MDKLGRNKILLLLLADRDALGSQGSNKGYVGNEFFGIDPGHALEGNLLSKRNDVFSDFSFTQPSLFPGLCYKNFTLFDQCPMSEKMEGIRQIAKLKESKADEQIFDAYAKQFNGFKTNRQYYNELDFYASILAMKNNYIGCRDNILRVFEERLNVDNYNFNFDRTTEEGRNQHKGNVDTILNSLDGLEKLTSTTVGWTKTSQIALKIPQIIDSNHRKEWHVRQENTNIVFSSKGKETELKLIQKQIVDFGKRSGFDLSTITGIVVDSKGSASLSLTVNQDTIKSLGAVFSYDNIMSFKHPPEKQNTDENFSLFDIPNM